MNEKSITTVTNDLEDQKKKDYYIKYAKENFEGTVKDIVLEQINNYFEAEENYKLSSYHYNIGDDVILKKGKLLHGTWQNIDGLVEIVSNGFLASWFVNGRNSKYPSSVGVWNLKKDYYLKDYVNFYSGGTIRYNNMDDEGTATEVISYSEMKNIMNIIESRGFYRWYMEQTKESRFLPSFVQKNVQIGIILNSDNTYINKLMKYDILSLLINDDDVKQLVNENYYEQFLKDRKNKDDFFTDRESAILFGIPSCFIEGIIVGRIYEKDKEILEKIKLLLPNCYLCNLDGKVIVE